VTGDLPRVAIFFTGGTIDSVGADRLDLAWYIEAGQRLEQGAFLERIPEIHSLARVEETSFRRLSSHALVDKDWLDLLRTVQDTLDQHARRDGVLPEPDAQDRQAGGAGRGDATVVGDQRGRLPEPATGRERGG
jgi:L-asparaginase/Glu-tRNA(Gln) amidotransferase subunit D